MAFVDRMQRNRFELKYVIDERTAVGVRNFIRAHLVRDPFAKAAWQWAYPIYSVYLDGPGLDLFNATLAGHRNRFKLRARYYDANPTGPVFFEVKRRVNDVILKDRAPVKRSAAMRLINGARPTVDDLLNPRDPEAFKAVLEFHRLQTAIAATGRTIVAYTREAYNAKDNDDVRVTFDRKIAGSWYDGGASLEQALRIDRPWTYPPPPPEGGSVVLELKFTGCYPRWMEPLTASFDLYRSRMAKYVSCVEAMGCRAHGVRLERFAGRQRRETLV